MPFAVLEERIAEYYARLPSRLKYVADYVVGHQVDVATRTLRYVSGQAGVSPSTLTRFAQALDFETYEDVRDLCRQGIDQKPTMAERAGVLRLDAASSEIPSYLQRQLHACQSNIGDMQSELTEAKLEGAVRSLAAARHVTLYGAFSSSGIAEYFSYLANLVSPNWRLVGRLGSNLSTALIDLAETDAVVIITHAPHAKKALMVAEMAAEQKAYVVVLTNTYACPALKFANVGFVAPSEGPHFFSSYAATIALVETIVGMLAVVDDGKSQERIALIEERGQALDDFWEN